MTTVSGQFDVTLKTPIQMVLVLAAVLVARTPPGIFGTVPVYVSDGPNMVNQ